MSLGMGIPTPQGYQWVLSMGGSAPPNAVVCGYDGGEPIYIGRANHGGGLIPGKVHQSHGCCYVSWGGKEHSCRQYEVLCTIYGGQPNWQNAYGGQIPPGAVQGGRTETGEPLYVGRHIHSGNMIPGKVQRSHSCIYIPYAGDEHSYRDYDVLVSGGSYEVPPQIPGYPYPGYPSYPNPPSYPAYPGYPGGNPPGTCGRWGN